jgi:STE24 endopeptidase
MDFLHTQLDAVQKHLAFVATDSINWKGYVQAFSWSVALFETYLLFRQYPLYSKTEPPAVLAAHFGPETDTFEKSQKYGKDKAKFSIFSGLYKQCIDSAMVQYGFYAWAWAIAGKILVRFGYGPEYEVSYPLKLGFIPYFACRSFNPSPSAPSSSSCL